LSLSFALRMHETSNTIQLENSAISLTAYAFVLFSLLRFIDIPSLSVRSFTSFVPIVTAHTCFVCALMTYLVMCVIPYRVINEM